MSKQPGYFYIQSAVLPFLIEDDEYKIVMVTTRKGKKWTLPKGIVEPGLTAPESAEREAEEEAGIKGHVEQVMFDWFQYEKWGGTCTVKVYLMYVKNLQDRWEEDHIRERRLFSPEEAMQWVGRKDIRSVLQKFVHHVAADY